jgi:hypothetical protein
MEENLNKRIAEAQRAAIEARDTANKIDKYLERKKTPLQQQPSGDEDDEMV